jgi:hypothetical protein
MKEGKVHAMNRHGKTVVLALAMALPVAPASVQAVSLTFDLDIEFSGATPPAGTAPWISATFDDAVNPGFVRLTMSADNLVGTEFIDDWLFNLDPALDPTALMFTPISNVDSVPNSISTGVDAFQADGDGKYDILFDFPPPPGTFASEFTTGETVIYDISGIVGLTANSFDFLSAPAGGHGPFKSAAHIQGIGPTGNDSGWIAPDDGNGGGPPTGSPVPEPGTLVLMGLGLVGLGWVARRRA